METEKKTEQLYDMFGELIYLIAIADGEIQQEELDRIAIKLKDHPWAYAVNWSFNYERSKGKRFEDVFNKILNRAENYGPSKEYQHFLDVMTEVAEASDGISPEEREVIEGCRHELITRFT